jgi:hypothetical protein
VATPHIGDGRWSVAAMPRTEPSTTGTQVPGVERSIGERPSNRCGAPVTGIRRMYPPEANGALGRDADGCASCCRRFRVRHASGEWHRACERGAGTTCRGSIFTAFRWTRPEGSPRASSPAAVLTTAPLACHSLNASVSQQVVLGHPDETQAESAESAASDLRSIHIRNRVAALRRHGVTCPPDLPW